jgi:hypothetical protein
VIGSGPISDWIMGSMAGRAGLVNWQWLFLLEGVSSIAMGLLTLCFVADKPRWARWLTTELEKLLSSSTILRHIATKPVPANTSLAKR